MKKLSVFFIILILLVMGPVVNIHLSTTDGNENSDITCEYHLDVSSIVIQDGFIHDNLLDNGDFSVQTYSNEFADYWNSNDNGLGSLVNGVQFVENVSSGSNIYLNYVYEIENNIGDIFYYSLDYYNLTYELGLGTSKLRFRFIEPYENYYPEQYLFENGNYSGLYQTLNDSNFLFWVHDQLSVVGSKYGIDNAMLFNLTTIYGAGNEPTIDEFEKILILATNPDAQEWNYWEYDIQYTDGFDTTLYASNTLEAITYNPTDYQTLLESTCEYTAEDIGDVMLDRLFDVIAFRWVPDISVAVNNYMVDNSQTYNEFIMWWNDPDRWWN